MTYTVIYNNAGDIVSTGTPVENYPGLNYMEVEEPIFRIHTLYVKDGEIRTKPSSPGYGFVFNAQTEVWEDARELAEVQTLQRERINSERLKANQSYFTHLGKQIAVDPLSRSDIDAINGEIANTGVFPAGWPGAWKCEDNTWLPIESVDDWKALYTAMVNQGTANFAHSQALKAQINAATTIAEVEAVSW